MSDKDKKDTKEINAQSGLRVRRSAPEKVVAVKPRKMQLIKPKRKEAETMEYANSSLLVFPTDPLGITVDLKAALIKSASKIGTDTKTIQLIEEVINIGRKHIQAKFKQNEANPSFKSRGAPKMVQEVLEVPEDTEEAVEPVKTPAKGTKTKGKGAKKSGGK